MFSEKYISARAKENRVYTDNEVAQLPDIPSDHPHYNEWLIRKHSGRKLINYLNAKGKNLRILEIGCGNGWLAGMLATIKGATVLGIDINEQELEQAKRVFASYKNLQFANIDIGKGGIGNTHFDVIVFAASIQYFPSLNDIITTCLSHLNPGGEIHIVDTQLYKISQIHEAKERSIAHYRSIGCEEMADYYFHHDKEQLNRFDHKILYDPYTILNKLFKPHPFPWIVVYRKIK